MQDSTVALYKLNPHKIGVQGNSETYIASLYNLIRKAKRKVSYILVKMCMIVDTKISINVAMGVYLQLETDQNTEANPFILLLINTIMVEYEKRFASLLQMVVN